MKVAVTVMIKKEQRKVTQNTFKSFALFEHYIV